MSPSLRCSLLQVIKEDVTGDVHMQMYGADMPVIVQKPREFELSRHMHPPQKQDFSDVVQSPMPGTVISYAVQPGDIVEIGQELCIIEAMKMQNIIRSHRAGVIESCNVNAGSSVARDEIIIKLVPEEKEENSENIAA